MGTIVITWLVVGILHAIPLTFAVSYYNEMHERDVPNKFWLAVYKIGEEFDYEGGNILFFSAFWWFIWPAWFIVNSYKYVVKAITNSHKKGGG